MNERLLPLTDNRYRGAVFPDFFSVALLLPTLLLTNRASAALLSALLLCVDIALADLLQYVLRRCPLPLRYVSAVFFPAGAAVLTDLLCRAFLPRLAAGTVWLLPLCIYGTALAAALRFLPDTPCTERIKPGKEARRCGLFLLRMTALGFLRELLGLGRLLSLPDGSGGVTFLTGRTLPLFGETAGAFLLLGLFSAIGQFFRALACRGEKKRNHTPTDVAMTAAAEAPVLPLREVFEKAAQEAEEPSVASVIPVMQAAPTVPPSPAFLPNAPVSELPPGETDASSAADDTPVLNDTESAENESIPDMDLLFDNSADEETDLTDVVAEFRKQRHTQAPKDGEHL